jgi:hypothetical protein
VFQWTIMAPKLATASDTLLKSGNRFHPAQEGAIDR